MKKPIVFLSHSSQDKVPLAALKKILDARAAGSLEFFLSSDGKSIKFGRNWVVSVSDALSEAKLMFVFLSPGSADSKWIHFEAGCAYAQDIRVIPVCLPGIDLNRITPPLSLLQGFNFHSHDAMGNIARICNETFEMTIKEEFTPDDFKSVILSIEGGGGFFGDLTWAIDSIKLEFAGIVPSEGFDPFLQLHEICKKLSRKSHYFGESIKRTRHDSEVYRSRFELPGCNGIFTIRENPDPSQPQPPTQVLEKPPTPNTFRMEFVFSPVLFHENAALLDQWTEQANLRGGRAINVIFDSKIRVETIRHRLTTKMYGCGIETMGLGGAGFKYEDFVFSLNSVNHNPILRCPVKSKIANPQISTVIEKLFASEVFWEEQPNSFEIPD